MGGSPGSASARLGLLKSEAAKWNTNVDGQTEKGGRRKTDILTHWQADPMRLVGVSEVMEALDYKKTAAYELVKRLGGPRRGRTYAGVLAAWWLRELQPGPVPAEVAPQAEAPRPAPPVRRRTAERGSTSAVLVALPRTGSTSS
jgi:hypothetical protein